MRPGEKAFMHGLCLLNDGRKCQRQRSRKPSCTITLNKIAGALRIPQSTLREHYLDTISLLVEHDPATYVRELMFDADQLNFFLHDKARSQEIVKSLVSEEKAGKEQEKKPRKKKKSRNQPSGNWRNRARLPNRRKKTSFPVSVNTVRRVLRL